MHKRPIRIVLFVFTSAEGMARTPIIQVEDLLKSLLLGDYRLQKILSILERENADPVI